MWRSHFHKLKMIIILMPLFLTNSYSQSSENGLQSQNHFEVHIHSKANTKFNPSSILFLTPLKYQVKNELLYKTSSESMHETFAVQLYKEENSLSSSYFPNFISAPTKPKGLATINILNSFRITLLPFFDWNMLRYNDFYSKNNLTPTPKSNQNAITLFQID